MSVRVTVQQLQERLPELLDRAVQSGEEYIVQRDGQDYAVIMSVHEWGRRTTGETPAVGDAGAADAEESRSRQIGARLDALGPEYRLSPEKQERMEALLAQAETTPLSPAERRELEALVEECDAIMLRRAQALPRIG
jgi:antitoxin (DNA-binding transcriptional repressor) of toxin-antitoxin stability system